MKSSDISAKYSWPSREQKEEIQDSGVAEEEDIFTRRLVGTLEGYRKEVVLGV